MPAKRKPTGTDADLNLSSLSRLFTDENAAREFLEKRRWPNGPVCPHCKATDPYVLTPRPGSKSPVRPGVYKCRECLKQFSVRIGTIFEESRLPLSKWLMAIHLMTSSKKGISSHQIARELGVTVKTAWFLTHRLREAMKGGSLTGLLSGIVECDETYVGGKPRKQAHNKNHYPTGRGTKKAPVAALVERDGSVVCKPVERVDSKTLKSEVRKAVDPSAVIMTDEWRAYSGLNREFAAHHVINHGRRRYVKQVGDLTVSTNTVESFFALLKRGHYGVFHQLSKRHLHRYCDEFAFRWNLRKMTDGERIAEVIKGAEGKRLRYTNPAAA
jgi:transposase-like protein